MAASQYYVSIHSPQDARKDLLETAKLTVNVLKAEYRVKQIRSEKKQRLGRLKELSEEMSATIEAIEKALPDHDSSKVPDAIKELQERQKKEREKKKKRAEKEQKAAEKKASEEEKQSSVKKPKKKSEADEQLEKLEDKLSQIESKLNKL